MHSWIRLLLLLLSGVTSLVRCCDWLRHYGHFSNNSLSLLDQMGGQKVKQECPVSFPYPLYRSIRKAKVESRIKLIKDSLELIINLYSHNVSFVNWATSKTEIFLLTLHRQKDGLTPCVSDRKLDHRLKRYYRKLVKSTLYEMSFSPDSWELIRKETKKHLEQLDLLVASIKHHIGSQ